MSVYMWHDADSDWGRVSATREDRIPDIVALVVVSERGSERAVCINAEQAKELEAFFAGLVMSLPTDQRA